MADDNRRVRVWVQRFTDRRNLMLQWHDPDTGRCKTKTTGTDDPKNAEDQRADLEYRLNHGQRGVAANMSWDRFRELFESEYVANLRPTSQEKLASVFDVFEQVAHPARLRSVNERMLSQFVKGLRERRQKNGKVGLAPITIRNYLIALKTALGWAKGQRLLIEVPEFPESVSKK